MRIIISNRVLRIIITNAQVNMLKVQLENSAGQNLYPISDSQHVFLTGKDLETFLEDLELKIKQNIYKVGAIYITTSSTFNPATLIPGSTWEKVKSGQLLVGRGQGTDDRGTAVNFNSEFYTGEYRHTLTVDEMASHNHRLYMRRASSGSANYDYGASTSSLVDYTEDVGGGASHNNIMAVRAVNIWKRVS